MSGHSKWSTIKRAKGAADQKRGMTFTKLGNIIALSARQGGADIESNPRLRMAIEAARGANMPKDNIQRAIDRGLGKLPGQFFEEVTYEGFGPGKVAFIIEAVTDNKNRTLAEIKNAFDRSGGGLSSAGSVLYMFDKIGEIKVSTKGLSVDDEILELIDLGAQEVEDYLENGVQKYLVYTSLTSLNEVSNNITQSAFTIEAQEVVQKPNLTTEITDPEIAKKVLSFTEKLEESDDVHKIYANFNIAEELL